MSTQVTCRHCGRHVPISHEGRHTAICPRCQHVLTPSERRFQVGGLVQPFADCLRELLGSAEGMGIAALLAACLSFPVLCIPFLGYASVLASLTGVGLGLRGLWRAWAGPEAADAARDSSLGLHWHQQRRFAFPLAG